MKLIKNLLALTATVLLTFLTGCATTTNNFGNKVTGEKAYNQMVEKFNIQGLDLSDPDFKSLKENMICHFDDTASYYPRPNHPVVSVCYSENDKVNFVFFTKIDKSFLNDIGNSSGYVSARGGNSFRVGEFENKCPGNVTKEKLGLMRICSSYSIKSQKDYSKFYSYNFQNGELLVSLGEKTLKEENDTTSLLPKIREVLIKVK